MMVPITDEKTALIHLARLIQPDACPTLDDGEQLDILRHHVRGKVWAASTARNIGDIVIPTAPNRNGHRYMAVAFVTPDSNQENDTTEPDWSVWRDSHHTDGNVIWQENGWDWDGVLWNLDAAAEEAWVVKASKSIGRVDFAYAQNVSVSASQLYDHCMTQAARFRAYYCL